MLARDTANKVQPIIEPTVTHLGYELVRVTMTGTARYATLQIMAEPLPADDGTRRQMTVDDCERISRSLSAVLDVADPITMKYSLEVSSPGIDRPLTKPEHFTRFAGHLAIIDLVMPTEAGRKRFTGIIQSATDDTITLVVDEQPIEFAFTNIAKAKLVLTDELIKAGISN